MKTRPIIMSTESVQALQLGLKTQTRRVVRAREPLTEDTRFFHSPDGWLMNNPPWGPYAVVRCPYGAPGDRLYVRETCVRFTGLGSPGEGWLFPPESSDPYTALLHVAGNEKRVDLLRQSATCVTVPSIFMPRWASRLTLEVTEVRVERLHDITEADAKAEGILPPATTQDCPPGKARYLFDVMSPYFGGGHIEGREKSWSEHAHRIQFALGWDRLNKRRGFGWETNPWVFAITFKRVYLS